MKLRTSRTGRTAAAIIACAAVALGGAPASAAPEQADLAERINSADLNRHLVAMQRIADQNDGHRASGTPGYTASVEYVAGKLRDAGFNVETPEFSYTGYFLDKVDVAVGENPIEKADAFEYSPATPQGGLTAPLSLAKVDETPGCEPEDFQGGDIEGSVVLIQRGACDFATKQQIAADHGAVGTIIYNNEDGELNGTLGGADAGAVPTVGVPKAVGEALSGAAGAPVHLDVQARFENITTRNVIAETRTGRADNVVLAGSHLDGVQEGAGINDNATGTAGVLASALAMGSNPDINNKVRFAFWGAEESGLIGSTKYVEGLSFEQQLDIAMYLNFDMIGSPNAGYFTYDGDDSEGEGAGPGPQGSAQIEQDFIQTMAGIGVELGGADFNGRSDYGPFIEAGIPAGGLNTGADGIKTEEQAAKWGGTAGEMFDPNYHTPKDNLSNVDRVALERNSKGIAAVVSQYADSTEHVNGTANRAERAELRSAESQLTASRLSTAESSHGHGCGHDHA